MLNRRMTLMENPFHKIRVSVYCNLMINPASLVDTVYMY